MRRFLRRVGAVYSYCAVTLLNVYYGSVVARPEPTAAIGTLTGQWCAGKNVLVVRMPAPVRRRAVSLLSEPTLLT